MCTFEIYLPGCRQLLYTYQNHMHSPTPKSTFLISSTGHPLQNPHISESTSHQPLKKDPTLTKKSCQKIHKPSLSLCCRTRCAEGRDRPHKLKPSKKPRNWPLSRTVTLCYSSNSSSSSRSISSISNRRPTGRCSSAAMVAALCR